MAKRPSRAEKLRALLNDAAAVEVPLYSDVIVVGGGAAGLVAAITAAEAGATTVVLEASPECGRTILPTGNGRCNFANVRLDERRFSNPEFVNAVCGERWLDDVLSFFRTCGLRWCLEDDRLYPMSRQSSSVRNVLLARARKAGVVLAPVREVIDVSFIPQLEAPFNPSTDDPQGLCHYDPAVSLNVPAGLAEVAHVAPLDKVLQLPGARTVIVATGGAALPALGELDMRTIARRPALCPLACEPSPLSQLDGRRVHVQAFHTKAGDLFPSWRERGEVLFRDYGLSGIVTFDLSRRADKGDLVELDLAPDVSRSDLQQLVDPFASGSFEAGCLDGVLDPEIARVLEDLARKHWHVDWPERDAAQTDSQALISLVKALPFVVVGPTDNRTAQVTQGGLDVTQFDPHTLACLEHPWLFACGEALDVDGDCGGFNLAWAWKSGMVAGAAAARWSLS